MIDNLLSWITENEVKMFYILLVVSLLINRLPFIGVFFRTVNTMLHESGHAIAALLTSGEVVRIEIYKDTSGVAETKSFKKSGAFITSFAGYPFAAAMSAFLLVLALNGQFKIVAFILLSLTVVNLFFFVRNTFGFIWLILFAALLVVSVMNQNQLLQKLLILFICLITFTESLTSTLVVTTLGFTKPKKSGDMANMQKSTGIPAAFWSLVNLLIVAGFIYYTITNYFPSLKNLLS